MKTNFIRIGCVRAALGFAVLAPVGGGMALSCRGQSAASSDNSVAAASLPPIAQDAVKLTKAGVGEEIILNQIKSSGASVTLSTDQVLYLVNLGVTQNVIRALTKPNADSPPAASATAYPSVEAGRPSDAAASATVVPASTPPMQAPPAYAPAPANYSAPPATMSTSVVATVSADTPWYDTGIDIASGATLAFSAEGRVALPSGRPGYRISATPAGDPTIPTDYPGRPFVAPGLVANSLVGRIGNSVPFQIGAGARVAINGAGRLFLSVNSNYFGNNAGAWRVTIGITQPSPEPAAVVAGPPPAVSIDYFQAQLSPYGNWVQTSYGLCWHPDVASSDPYWRPYCNEGQWTYTDSGFYWQSTYPWGDVAFHYGRWYYEAGAGGWLWVPGYDWGPGWVAWRHAESEGYTGWAPLPPSVGFTAGVGLMYHGQVALDIDFGLPQDAFIFVGYDHFWDHDYRRYAMPHDRVALFWGRTEVRNSYRFDRGRFIVDGIGRERMSVLTHHEVRVEDSRAFRAREEREHFEARRVELVRHEQRPDAHGGPGPHPGPAPASTAGRPGGVAAPAHNADAAHPTPSQNSNAAPAHPGPAQVRTSAPPQPASAPVQPARQVPATAQPRTTAPVQATPAPTQPRSNPPAQQAQPAPAQGRAPAAAPAQNRPAAQPAPTPAPPAKPAPGTKPDENKAAT